MTSTSRPTRPGPRPARWTRAALLVASFASIAALLTAARPARAAAPCLASATTEPRNAVTGQQVIYRARVLRRHDVTAIHFTEPIAFPDLRTAWLPGRAEETTVERDGETYRVREEHRALFPARAGRHVLPAFGLRCDLAGGGAFETSIPGTSLDVRAPPEAGRPAGFDGAIGPLYLQLQADRREIALGESVKLSLLVRGGGNVWVVPEPFTGPLDPGVEIFRQPTELDSEPGERLFMRRFSRLDWVPHVAGRFEIPTVSVPYFDPVSRRYATARTEPLVIHVAQRPREARESGSETATRSEAQVRPTRVRLAAQMAGAIVGVGATAGLAFLFVRRRLDARRRLATLDDALDRARKAAADRDPAAEARALTAALRAALDAAGARTRAEQRRAADRLLESLEATRFAAAPGPPDREAVERLVEDLRQG